VRWPYLQHLLSQDGIACFIVDGHALRDAWDVEFTNGAHHFTRRYVPPDEVWIDREAPGAGELDFLVQHQLEERAFMAAGAPYLVALRRASYRERQRRRAAVGHERLPLELARARVRRKLLGRRGDMTLWLVDGRGVRDHFYPEFTLGGHGLRYRYISRREIWNDDAVVEAERPAIVLHEARELELMRKGLDYSTAHRHASAAERRFRQARWQEFGRSSSRLVAIAGGAAAAGPSAVGLCGFADE
jgi:hypothetical protein